MALTREEKENIVSDLKEKITSQKGSVFLSFSHLSADDLSHLRQEAKAKDCLFKVVKKTLLKLAFPKEAELDKILEKKEGSVALMLGFQDEIAPAKLAYNFTLDHPEAEIEGGWWQGQLQPAEEAVALAKVPDYQTLVQQLVGVFQAPIASFTRVLENNYKGLLTCLSQIKN